MNRYNLVTNGLIDNFVIDEKGKGHKFVSKFIEAGLVHYKEYGDILITKETLDKFINTMVGCPVIINHKQVTDNNVENERVGVISNVWFNPSDGWYYCDGIIWNKQAIDLVKNQGWNVSCAYSFESDRKPLKYHGKNISMEFTNGNFQHLAIVETPRYEDANIVINSVEFDESKHPRDEQGRFTSLNKTQSDELGKALYTINKEAKKIRDFRNEIKDLLFYGIPISDTTIEKLNDIYKDDNIKFTEYGKPYLDDMYDGRYESAEDVKRELESVEDEEEEKELEDLLWEFNYGTIAHINLHNLLSDEEYEKQALYDLKQDVLTKYNPEKIGMHRFNDDTVRELYKIGNFTFHGEDISEELNQEQIDALDKLEDISSENKLLESEQMDINKAKEILKEYLSEDVYNCVFNGGAGSGDFDHAGRPTLVGGSEPAGTGRNGKYEGGHKQWIGAKPKQQSLFKTKSEKTNIPETNSNIDSLEDKANKYKEVLKRYKENNEKRRSSGISSEEYYKAYDEAEKAKRELTKVRKDYAESIMKEFKPVDDNSYEEHLQNRKEKYLSKSNKLKENSHKAFEDFDKKMKAIPAGQPIHGVKDRNYREKAWDKLGKSVELSRKADYYKGKADSVGTAGISSDDKNAIAKLADKYNKTSSSAERRRIIDRVISIHSKTNSNKPKTEETELGFKVERNNDINRLQLKFDGKPDANTRSILKSNGFRWSPREGAWQRQLNANSERSLKKVNEELKNIVHNSEKRKENLVMTALNDLENFVKNIVSNACEKDKEKEVMNEDKRKLIDEVGGILKGKVDDEIIRTIIGKLEKVAYEPSEDDKAVNKCKNEDEEDKKEFIKEKEIATGRKDEVKNSMDAVRQAIYSSSSQVDTSSLYMTREERIEQGNEY